MDAEKVRSRKNMKKLAVVLLKAREIIPEEKNIKLGKQKRNITPKTKKNV